VVENDAGRDGDSGSDDIVAAVVSMAVQTSGLLGLLFRGWTLLQQNLLFAPTLPQRSKLAAKKFSPARQFYCDYFWTYCRPYIRDVAANMNSYFAATFSAPLLQLLTHIFTRA
jgi:hypothetical protein